MDALLIDIGIIIVIATIFAYIARGLKQPAIVAYVLAGVLIGPVGLGLITDANTIYTIAELGIAFLLFAIGLEIDIKKLKGVGKAVLGGTIIQVTSTFFLGYFIASLFGMNNIMSIYIGLLLAFSSTMIVAKLLSDKNEINTLHGRIMIGILIIQDIIVVMALPLLGSMTMLISYEVIAIIALKGLGLFALALLLNKFVFMKVLDRAAKTHEVLFLTAIAVCFMFIGLSYLLGFSIVIGAFIGGLALAEFPYNVEIIGETHSLRDFFSVIFFTSLGMQLTLAVFSTMLLPFLILLFAIIFIKPLILSVTYLLWGYGGRLSSIIGLGLGQASEFSFILASQGLLLGHLTADIYSLIVSIVVVSMIITPYFMKFRNNIYKSLAFVKMPSLQKYTMPKKIHKIERKPAWKMKDHVVVFGCDMMGGKVVDYLIKRKKRFTVADHNPERVNKLRENNINCLYGDADSDELLKTIGLYNAKLLISTIPDSNLTSFMIMKARRFNPKINILARAHTKEDADRLYKAGADYVIMPDVISGEKIVSLLGKFLLKK
ncbi:MAG: cation:proton antiporter [Nanoarchaeota archaeon]|nr:cation:proton antiporter [Nanoarchaeota archaeon]MBU1135348.1 cation:proton antiporter [Nanoarchaeota archaeon]MBU2519712.1 cation:proton antiporter [Nanoarchaeota archaeon]